ncbi:gluconokinase [Actinokineospora auranticolor]|uniref:Gluconokinase n=1 Tax=Actinokineospora auranticolor TaxID=155976 RepID=A0A2S6GDW1_9PSEU|nr:gluconokinase [Actinokineospora auranticolor]PPK63428.1 gluconokinase [Actinokineospora auranticolor]
MDTVVVVMGVSGSGKTTLAAGVAGALGVPLAEADEFHSAANIAKMRSGTPLTDEDRWPWLRAIGDWIRDRAATGGGVVTCSALKRAYRDLLRESSPHVFFVELDAPRALLADRMANRSGHFMPASLLDSQLAVLEPLDPAEPGVRLDATATPADLVEAALRAVPTGGNP